jgi:integral membrane sensor domain MASE1
MNLAARRAGETLAAAAVYVGAAKLGFALAFVDGTVSAVWPPTGLSLALVLLFGPRMAVAVVLGEVAANMTNGADLGLSLAFGVGNALEALAARALLRRAGFRPQLDRVRDVFALLGLAAIVSTMVSATVALGAFAVDGLPAAAYWDVWHVWWLGDLTGDLIVAPLLFVLAVARPTLPRGWRAAELGAFVLALAVMFALASRSTVGAGYLALPVLLWGALRFGQLGAASANAALCGAAVVTAATAGSELARVAVAERVLYTQNFVAVAAITTLAVAALIAERRRAEADLRASEARANALADEQGALRRVAEAVARHGEVFWTIAAEAAQLLGGAAARVERRHPHGVVAYWSDGRALNGIEVSAPVFVGGANWGRVTVSGVEPGTCVAERLERFAELAGLAVANAQPDALRVA